MAKVIKFKINGVSSALENQHVVVIDTDAGDTILMNERTLTSDSSGNVTLNVDSTGKIVGDALRVFGDDFPAAGVNQKGFNYVGLVESVVEDSLSDVITDMDFYVQSDIASADTILAGKRVTQWGDLTGNGNHMVQADTDMAFTSGGLVNGHNSLVATEDTVMPIAANMYDLPSDDFTMFIVAGLYGSNADSRLFGGSSGGGTRVGVILDRDGVGSEALCNTSFNPAFTSTRPNGITVIGLIVEGTNLKMFINGDVIDFGAQANSLTPDFLAFGTTFSLTSGTVNAAVMGMGGLRRAITASEVATIGAWTDEKYGSVIGGLNLVWDGDSRTNGFGAVSEVTIPTRSQLLSAITPTFHNISVNGQTTANMITRFAGNVPQSYSAYHAKNVYVINGAGINDMTQGSDSASIITNLTTLCNNAQAAGFDVMIATVPPRDTSTAAQEQARNEVNSWIMTTALASLTAREDICADGRLGIYNTTYYSDITHFNDAGQDIWSQIMTDALVRDFG